MYADKSISIIEARKTLNQVNLEIPTFPIGHENREILEQTAVELESLIWHLVHEDITQISEDLKAHQLRLQELKENLNTRTASLEKITKMIQNVSQLIGTLTGMAG